MRIVNEKLGTNEKFVVERDNSRISNILFAPRTEKGADDKSAFEKQTGRKLNTLKLVMVENVFQEKIIS